MALASATPFASFDISAQTNVLDISPVLAEAIYLDFNLLNNGLNFDLNNVVEDTTFYWNQESLNSDTATTSASATSTATSIGVTAGQGTRFRVGDLLTVNDVGQSEVIQVTAVSTDTLTVVRTINSTTALSIASGATLSIMHSDQEGSDIGSDGSVAPSAYSNYTQIKFSKDLQISGSQLARRMATIGMDVNRQLANRATELKRDWSRTVLYGEPSTAGSDTIYRSTRGLRSFCLANSGVSANGSAAALTWAVLNTQNKSVVDKGLYPDTIVCGTDLVGSIVGFDSSLRRMLETDTQVGYTVNLVTLAQGNEVMVVVDPRVNKGDLFLYKRDLISLKPLIGRGLFMIAATDFVDGVKRRIGSEMGLEVRHPETVAYLTNYS